MKTVLAGIAALCLSASAAVSATYQMFDHASGANAATYDYGLRLESAPGTGAADYWSFEDMAGTSRVSLSVDIGAGTGSVTGTMRHNLDGSDWSLDLTLTGVVSLASIGAGADSFGATYYSGTLSNGGTVFELIGKGKGVHGTSYHWTYFSENPGGVDWRAPNISAGWVSSLDGGQTMTSGTNDFIGQMTAVPLPAPALLLLSGLAGMGLIRRRKTA